MKLRHVIESKSLYHWNADTPISTIMTHNFILTRANLGMMSRMMKMLVNLKLSVISHACHYWYYLLVSQRTKCQLDLRLHLMTLTSKKIKHKESSRLLRNSKDTFCCTMPSNSFDWHCSSKRFADKGNSFNQWSSEQSFDFALRPRKNHDFETKEEDEI